jgi:hypothetical protein
MNSFVAKSTTECGNKKINNKRQKLKKEKNRKEENLKGRIQKWAIFPKIVFN